MPLRTESRIAIAGTVSEVWAYLCDVGRWSEWAPTVRECRVVGGGPVRAGAKLEQRAKGILGTTHHRSQHITLVHEPSRLAFAGPMATSTARWGMHLEALDDGRTDATMWIEIDRAGVMRAIPSSALKGRVQRVMDVEMAAIKAAVESGTP
jgi:hypothetical protein